MRAPFWFIASAFALEIVFGMASEAMQLNWDVEKIQAQNVLLGVAALTALSYRSPIGKGMILLGVVWATWVLATDWWIPKDWPSWIPAVEGTFFLAWLCYLWKKHDSLSRGEATGRAARNGDLPSDGPGWRRGADRE